ncbi:hypothetical protein V8B97DRAFT_545361 [Scleroderma yunnanense]
MCIDSGSMYMINVNAFIEREQAMDRGKKVDCGTKVIELCDDEGTDYAILSHRWITGKEVDYKEMTKLAKMKKHEQEDIRQRAGYRKILASSEQAKKDGYKWLWVDTCCIDKRSSADLSEAINSMYRWYENSRVCYAYLNDVTGKSFPTKRDKSTYPNSNGYPEWFSRGWTLQEMIAPSNLQFFNNHWQPIGDKRTLARTLWHITSVPEHILKDGLSANRPCVAQIISWATHRTTTRVEDRAYSLLGLLDVNMPMLYGEGKKAFHRLQLEIIHTSNDQSIFAWGQYRWKPGSILADDPSFFWDCSKMELMDHDEFTEYLRHDIPEDQLPSIEADHFGTFPVTNRGIQIWMLLRPCSGSDSVFEARLPCRSSSSGEPVRINLALWKSNYYRFFISENGYPAKPTLQFRQVYLRYQDMPDRDVTFEVDDNAIMENGFTYCGAFPEERTGNTFTLTSTLPLCVKVYSDSQAHCLFAVGFGQWFGEDWIHSLSKNTSEYSWWNYAEEEYRKMLVRGPEHAQSMAEVRSRGGRYGRVYVKRTYLPGSTRIVRTSCVAWESRKCRVRIDAFQDPYNGSDQWMGLDVEGPDDSNCDMQGLMIPHSLRRGYLLLVDGVSTELSLGYNGIKVGDYGYFTDSEDFCCEGNILTDSKSLAMVPVITLRQHKIDQEGSYRGREYMETRDSKLSSNSLVILYKPIGLSLPSNHDVNSLLTSFSRLNKYLVTMVIQCDAVPSSEWQWRQYDSTEAYNSPTFDPTTPLCVFRKPFIWHYDKGICSALEE